MKESNVQDLTNLSKTCYRSGILPIFLGLLVIFVDIIFKQVAEIPAGLLVFVLGYVLVKIAQKINKVLESETK
ncbi:MAG: hypothetical protein HQL24_07120 [Candidatus Omnitrophica bacterium]|nr:hypothetical protein [Candidatus Omnitrophota bacterium]